MTSPAKSFHPPWATLCWTDSVYIYTEIPSASGPPFIQRYSLTEGGLTKALGFLKDHHARAKASGKPAQRFSETAVGTTTAKGRPRPGTPEQRARALGLIRRLKA